MCIDNCITLALSCEYSLQVQVGYGVIRCTVSHFSAGSNYHRPEKKRLFYILHCTLYNMPAMGGTDMWRVNLKSAWSFWTNIREGGNGKHGN